MLPVVSMLVAIIIIKSYLVKFIFSTLYLLCTYIQLKYHRVHPLYLISISINIYTPYKALGKH